MDGMQTPRFTNWKANVKYCTFVQYARCGCLQHGQIRPALAFLLDGLDDLLVILPGGGKIKEGEEHPFLTVDLCGIGLLQRRNKSVHFLFFRLGERLVDLESDFHTSGVYCYMPCFGLTVCDRTSGSSCIGGRSCCAYPAFP